MGFGYQYLNVGLSSHSAWKKKKYEGTRVLTKDVEKNKIMTLYSIDKEGNIKSKKVQVINNHKKKKTPIKKTLPNKPKEKILKVSKEINPILNNKYNKIVLNLELEKKIALDKMIKKEILDKLASNKKIEFEIELTLVYGKSWKNRLKKENRY